MKIKNIKIENFRLLKNFSIDLEKGLSLVIGKNNMGKTSFLSVLNTFLNGGDNYGGDNFSFEDFNLDFQAKLLKILQEEKINPENYKEENFKIGLRLEIELSEKDYLTNISNFMLDLDPNINTIILLFKYVLTYENYDRMYKEFKTYKKNFENEKDKDIDKKEIAKKYLKKNQGSYFKSQIKSIEVGNESNSIDIENKDIKKIINFKTVKAKRDVANSKSGALSKLSHQYYKAINSESGVDEKAILALEKQLYNTDNELKEAYKGIFKNVVDDIAEFSSNATKIEIHSSLNEKNLFDKNTTVVYEQEQNYLPEHYNGLGYMNLTAILFNIHIKIDEFKKQNLASENPADINLLFIEEPEAHTHPQMQYVFINSIKKMLKKGGEGINLQTIISTHSAHITSQSDFDDIKYFYLEKSKSINAKNLSDLKENYKDNEGNFRFLKQYITLNSSELFFAEKVIFIEGVTERVLLPAIMKKIDVENKDNDNYIPLLSQNISILEVGNYSHIFDKFLDFFEIKTLIITDIDFVNDSGKKCSEKEATKTKNHSFKHYFGIEKNNLDGLKKLKNKVIKRKDNSYISDETGNIMISYQTEENDYYARSFEDAFISLNMDFLIKKKEKFIGLKNEDDISKDKILNKETTYYKIAENCVDKKSNFAIDILLNSEDNFSNWKTPAYIKEGLEWLQQQ